MHKLLHSVQRWLQRGRRPAAAAPMAPPVPQIMQQLAATQPVELTCDEILRLMDECAEAAVQGGDISALMPLFQRHLEMCGDCREEYEGLLRILRAQRA